MLDIDRDRQRISLGLKQTQEDPWQRVVDTYNVGDELEGKVTKVVTFGAFVEILDGVEGLVHISELAQHHVENPREIIQPGDPVRVKILEIDSERRRLSLSIKRVEGQVLPVRPIEPPVEGDAESLDDMPELGLSEDVFSSENSAPVVKDSVAPRLRMRSRRSRIPLRPRLRMRPRRSRIRLRPRLRMRAPAADESPETEEPWLRLPRHPCPTQMPRPRRRAPTDPPSRSRSGRTRLRPERLRARVEE